MTIARIENGTIAEYRNVNFGDLPPHKRNVWLPVEYEGEGANVQTIVSADRVRVVRSHPPLTADDYAAAIEAHIDSVAAAKAYSGTVSLASYVNSSVPQWAAEAQAFVAWRDSVWLYAYGLMGAVQAGQATPPTVAELIAALPVIEWPE